MRRGRTASERDAATVETVYATVTGALLAAAGFTAVISPVLAGAVHGPAAKGCFTGAVIVAAALFCGRVALTLRRFERRNRSREQLGRAQDRSPDVPSDQVPDGSSPRHPASGPPDRPSDSSSDQPSQPGRTSPDS